MAKMKVDFEFSLEISVFDVVNALDVNEASARELLDGTIAFTKGELQEIAAYKGTTVDNLIKA